MAVFVFVFVCFLRRVFMCLCGYISGRGRGRFRGRSKRVRYVRIAYMIMARRVAVFVARRPDGPPVRRRGRDPGAPSRFFCFYFYFIFYFSQKRKKTFPRISVLQILFPHRKSSFYFLPGWKKKETWPMDLFGSAVPIYQMFKKIITFAENKRKSKEIMDIGAIVRQAARDRGFRLEDIAKAMKITRAALWSRLKDPKLSTLEAVAEILDMEVGDFFRRDAVPSEATSCKCPHCGEPVRVVLRG